MKESEKLELLRRIDDETEVEATRIFETLTSPLLPVAIANSLAIAWARDAMALVDSTIRTMPTPLIVNDGVSEASYRAVNAIDNALKTCAIAQAKDVADTEFAAYSAVNSIQKEREVVSGIFAARIAAARAALQAVLRRPVNCRMQLREAAAALASAGFAAVASDSDRDHLNQIRSRLVRFATDD